MNVQLPMRKAGVWLAAVFAALALSACSPRQMIVGSLADELSSQGEAPEGDLELARDAAPFYLKLSESVLRQNPGHARLAESVAAGFTQYAYAFVAFEADKIEAKNVTEADRLRRRAAGLYERAYRHAMAALEAGTPGFATRLSSNKPAEWPALRAEQAGLAYWAAAAWGGWISLSKDHPDIVADLPQAVRLAQLAWAADPAWGKGALTGLVATFEAARPSGSRAKAADYFDQSFAQSGQQSPGALVGKAESIAQPAGDRADFERLLRQALALPTPAAPSLNDAVMRQRAQWLLEQADSLF